MEKDYGDFNLFKKILCIVEYSLLNNFMKIYGKFYQKCQIKNNNLLDNCLNIDFFLNRKELLSIIKRKMRRTK